MNCMGWLVLAALVISPALLFPPLISIRCEKKRNEALKLIAGNYNFSLEISAIPSMTLMGPEDEVDVRRLTGCLNGRAIEIVDEFDVGLAFNFWAFRHYFYIFPLHSASTRLVVDGRKSDISSLSYLGFRTFASPASIRNLLRSMSK